LRYPYGSESDDYLHGHQNYISLITDKAAMELMRESYSRTGVVSELYPVSSFVDEKG